MGFAAVLNETLSESEREELIISNQENGYRMAWKLLSTWRVRLAQDEVKSVVGIALCEAAKRFDKSYNTSFKTFFFYHLRGVLLKEVSNLISSRNLLRYQSETQNGSMDEFTHHTYDDTLMGLIERKTPERLLQHKEVSEICNKAMTYLDDLEREIIVRYFVEDKSLMKIAKDLGYCRCHLSRVKNKALQTLAELLAPLSSATSNMPPKTTALDTEETLQLPKRSQYTGGRGRRKLSEKEAA